MKPKRASRSPVQRRQHGRFISVALALVLAAGCGRRPLHNPDAPPRANVSALRTWPGSPLLPAAAHLRAAGDRLVPEFDDVTGPVTARASLPSQANGQTHVEDSATGVGLDIALVGANASAAQVVDGYLAYPKAHALGSVYERADPSGVEDYVVLDQRPASPSIAYDLALGPKVAGLRLVENQLEMLDKSGVPRLRLPRPYLVGSDGRQTDAVLALVGCAVDTDPAGPWGKTVTAPGARSCRVRVSWADDSLSYPAILDPRWQTTGSLSVARQDHNLIYLPLTGKVLAVGGRSSSTSTTGLASAELYDKTSRTWSAAASMSGGRWSASATVLGSSSNGTTSQKILIAGGINGTASLTSAQLYNQTAGTWVAAGNLNVARHLHTATLLNDGRVLLCGGMNGSATLTSAALYNPASGSGSWAATTGPIPPNGWRFGTATLIATSNQQLNGKVLLSGGNDGSNSLSAVYLFDPVQSAFSTLASLSGPREGHRALSLSDGRILLTGGKSGSTYLASTVIFDPSWGPGNWNAAGNMTTPRWGHAMNLLPSGVLTQGILLVSGGSNGTSTLSSTEYWNGTNWATDGAMAAPVQQHGSVGLGSSILVAGGAISNGSTTVSAAEVYDPSIGLGCTSGSQCASGFCVSGVCCDSACNVGCGSCNLAGHVGVCTALPSGTVCRSSTGICDVAETCDGGSVACPANALQPSGTVCRASAGTCDVVETCTGQSATCPADSLQPSGTVCRPSAGDCDIAESCTGLSATCPADALQPATTVCRASAGLCDVAETCTGQSVSCPPNAFQPTTAVCRPAVSECDIADSCTGTSASCPQDSFQPDGTTCNNHACTQEDTCHAGVCVSGPPVVCKPQDACHVAGTCDPATGQCSNPPKTGGPTDVRPTAVCVNNKGAGRYEALFGYANPNSKTVVIPVGVNNQFLPGTATLGQLTDFMPITSSGAFSVIFDGNPLTWMLPGGCATASSASPACPTTACSPACRRGEQCVGGTCITQCGDGLCAGTEGCGTCPADCACAPGQVCLGQGCATPIQCGGVGWECGSGDSFGVHVDCGSCPAGKTCNYFHLCQ